MKESKTEHVRPEAEQQRQTDRDYIPDEELDEQLCEFIQFCENLLWASDPQYDEIPPPGEVLALWEQLSDRHDRWIQSELPYTYRWLQASAEHFVAFEEAAIELGDATEFPLPYRRFRGQRLAGLLRSHVGERMNIFRLTGEGTCESVVGTLQEITEDHIVVGDKTGVHEICFEDVTEFRNA